MIQKVHHFHMIFLFKIYIYVYWKQNLTLFNRNRVKYFFTIQLELIMRKSIWKRLRVEIIEILGDKGYLYFSRNFCANWARENLKNLNYQISNLLSRWKFFEFSANLNKSKKYSRFKFSNMNIYIIKFRVFLKVKKEKDVRTF